MSDGYSLHQWEIQLRECLAKAMNHVTSLLKHNLKVFSHRTFNKSVNIIAFSTCSLSFAVCLLASLKPPKSEPSKIRLYSSNYERYDIFIFSSEE